MPPRRYLEGHSFRCTCQGCKDLRAAISRAEYQNGGKTRMRATHLLRTYGITANQYAWLAFKQKHRCAICDQPETKTHKSGEPFELAVDHDHNTGTVRGLLCDKCNTILGRVNDNPDLLKAAARYLQRKPPTLPEPKPWGTWRTPKPRRSMLEKLPTVEEAERRLRAVPHTDADIPESA